MCTSFQILCAPLFQISDSSRGLSCYPSCSTGALISLSISKRGAGQAEGSLKARQAPLMLIQVWPSSEFTEETPAAAGTFPPAWRKFPSVRIARQFSRVATSVHRSLSQPTLLRNSGTLHSKEPTAKPNTTRVVEKMVYSATESVKKRLGSCEKVTMKLRSLLNISSISSTCASHKRLEGSLEVKDREFRSVTVTRGET